MKQEETFNEILRCKDDIIYFKDTYLNLEKYGLQDDILTFLTKNKISEINLERDNYKTTSVAIYILHKLLFSNDIHIGLVDYSDKYNKEFIYKVTKLYNDLPDFLKIKGNFLKTKITIGTNTLYTTSYKRGFRGMSFNILIIEQLKEKTDDIIELIKDEFIPCVISVENYEIINIGRPIFDNQDYRFIKTIETRKLNFFNKIVYKIKNYILNIYHKIKAK